MKKRLAIVLVGIVIGFTFSHVCCAKSVKAGDGSPPNPVITIARGDQGSFTLRDYFAGQVLMGIYASRTAGMSDPYPAILSRYAYNQADAMLVERAK